VVGKKNPPLDVPPIAKRIYELIATATPHEWLQWNGSAEVKILVGKALPSEHLRQQTLRATRRRLGSRLKELLVKMAGKKLVIITSREVEKPDVETISISLPKSLRIGANSFFPVDLRKPLYNPFPPPKNPLEPLPGGPEAF
jgi:hypothetical protein